MKSFASCITFTPDAGPVARVRGSFRRGILACVFALGPVAAGQAGIERVPLTERTGPSEGAAAEALFERLSSPRTGIDFAHRWDPPPEFAGDKDRPFAGGGVAVGDIDGDGMPDLLLTRPFGGMRLYRNVGGLKFEDATSRAGLSRADDKAWTLGAAFADVDNDGDLDLFATGYESPNRLYFNDGKGRFTERGVACGLAFAGASVEMAFADYDRDGDLDGYLVTNRGRESGVHNVTDPATLRSIESRLVRDPDGRLTVPEDLKEQFDVVVRPDQGPILISAGQFDRLYRNDGVQADGSVRFTEVTREAGVLDNGRGLSATWWDFDADGWPDLYVANDFYGPDRLWRNNRDGTFTDVARELLPHTAWFSMGTDAGDINNDGLIDLMTSDMAGSTHFKDKMGMGDMDKNGWFLEVPEPRQYMRNALFLNSGAGPFMEMAHMAGVAATDWTWTVRLADLDCDGWVDLYVTNGMTGDFLNSDLRSGLPDGARIPDVPLKPDRNMAFRNTGDLGFKESGKAWGIGYDGVSFGAAAADFDRDGDLDLVVNEFDGPASFFANRGTLGGRVLVELKGTKSNARGLGAIVRAHVGDQVLHREITLARGFASADEAVAHFGLGEARMIDRLEVRWPSGAIESFENVEAGSRYLVTEPDGAAPDPDALAAGGRAAAPQRFARVDVLATAVHSERPFDDFADQPLLPNRVSQLGPALAWADVDGNGHIDCYHGRAAGSGAFIYYNRGPESVSDGRPQFEIRAFEPFDAHAASEDLGAVFLDVDGDGDADLYVVSGGVEVPAGDPALQDRLYLNDGTGKFSNAPDDSLPDLRFSGGPVAAADFDRDGDLDLFVGGRVVPGAWPQSPGSRILENDGTGRFSDATGTVAPALAAASSGMATGALWSDVDGDGWLDLLVTREFDSILVLHNREGESLNPPDGATGIEEATGWWNGIAGADLDHDGDIDYVATNFGSNTKYHPEPDHPVLLYHGDLDGSGRRNVVEAKTVGDGEILPVRGKSCSQNAMPFLQEKFPKFQQFASATLDEIYGSALDEAGRLEVKELRTGILWNESEGPGQPVRLRFEPLPRLAQIAPAFGVVAADFDADGHPDIALAQNFFGPQRETGRMDGGLSVVLGGDGMGGFTARWPDVSGIVVQGDPTALTIADFNEDSRPDLVFARNDAGIVAFSNQSENPGRPIVLAGPPGNPRAIGARVTATATGRPPQTFEIHATSGYLSQSSPEIWLGTGPDTTTRSAAFTIKVVWPDGTATTATTSAEPGVREEIRWKKSGNS